MNNEFENLRPEENSEDMNSPEAVCPEPVCDAAEDNTPEVIINSAEVTHEGAETVEPAEETPCEELSQELFASADPVDDVPQQVEYLPEAQNDRVYVETPVSANPYYREPDIRGDSENMYAQKPPASQKKPRKKVNLGCIVFCIAMVLVFLISFVGFTALCGYVILTNDVVSDALNNTIIDEFIPDITESPEETQPYEDILEGGVIPNEDNEDYSDDTYMKLMNPPSDSKNFTKYTNQYAFDKISDSTVGVVCYVGEINEDAVPQSQGTGIVLSEDGYVVTNSHVIGDSRDKFKVRVVTNDGTTYEAKIIGYDSRTDLAVLKVSGRNLVPAEFCDSDKVSIGDDVIAVGNPGGMDFQNSLTKGIISAKDRELSLSSQVSYFQTDAAINPGNSGGPLCNMQGQVIGINTAKISSEDYEGMGFAIPTQTAKEVVDDLIRQGYVSGRVRIGITGQPVSEAMIQYYGLPTGILITEIAEDGPCDGKNIQVEDVVTAIDGEKVKNFSEVYKILATHEAGDEVTLSVYRHETKENLKVKITLMADEGDTQQ